MRRVNIKNNRLEKFEQQNVIYLPAVFSAEHLNWSFQPHFG